MVSLQCDVHLLTLRPDTQVPSLSPSLNITIITLLPCQVRDTDFSCYKYHDKAEARAQAERPYAMDKTSFAVARGHSWVLPNKRPERLRCLHRIRIVV